MKLRVAALAFLSFACAHQEYTAESHYIPSANGGYTLKNCVGTGDDIPFNLQGRCYEKVCTRVGNTPLDCHDNGEKEVADLYNSLTRPIALSGRNRNEDLKWFCQLGDLKSCGSLVQESAVNENKKDKDLVCKITGITCSEKTEKAKAEKFRESCLADENKGLLTCQKSDGETFYTWSALLSESDKKRVARLEIISLAHAIAAQRGPLFHCLRDYSQTLEGHPPRTDGALAIEIAYDSKANEFKRRIYSDTIGDQTLNVCTQKAINKMAFEASGLKTEPVIRLYFTTRKTNPTKD